MPFATTKHLNLRAYRESDKDNFIAQSNDQRVMRLANPGYVVPKSVSTWKELDESWISKTLVFIIIEVKKEYAGMRKWEEGEVKVQDAEKKQEDWDKELFAGHAALDAGMKKNRGAMLGIALTVPWFGNGFATEVTEWLVQHGFEQLNLHRITLGYTATNAPARRVYDKCGFIQEGVTKKSVWVDGRWVDEVLMAIMEEEYWERKKRLAAQKN